MLQTVGRLLLRLDRRGLIQPVIIDRNLIRVDGGSFSRRILRIASAGAVVNIDDGELLDRTCKFHHVKIATGSDAIASGFQTSVIRQGENADIILVLNI